MFTRAILRRPGNNFASGLTTVDLGAPLLDLALQQYAAYCEALAACGPALTVLDADLRFPDSTFVEDTAVLTPRGGVLMRPGAESRAGEVEAILAAVLEHFPDPPAITAPGTVDGGDICEAVEHFFIGVSHRTNEEGARQLAAILAGFGYSSSVIDVRGLSSILHLKSGIAWIGEPDTRPAGPGSVESGRAATGAGAMVVIEELAGHPALSAYERIVVASEEAYAANCVRVNERVLMAAGFPRLEAELRF